MGAVYGYRNDLKKLNEVEEAVIDIKTLPRYILSCNPKSFELLFQILDKGDAHSGEQTWNLVSRLTTNEAVYKRLAELEVSSDNKQPMWEKLIDVHSKYRLLYSHVLLSLIHICRCRRLLTCRSRWSPDH
eukprot:TRINITY_DN19256_c0_g1_i1.p1 TRINITY_DN19256_c0_g1~~TRINITY_DN19256_c0_g1_i1.p1  ORF type:complete len:130 (+),score=28.42 TRINITY_DN19256_c0_g1_i1:104-493(+)